MFQTLYVRPFGGPGRQERISTNGGTEPRWRRDGKELFYRSLDGRLVVVEVQTGATFSAHAPRALFDMNLADDAAAITAWPRMVNGF